MDSDITQAQLRVRVIADVRGPSWLVSRSEVDMRYAIVIEKAGSNFSGYVPDLPGCVATGATVEDTELVLREAIEFHLAGLREDGTPIPQSG